MVRMSDVIKRRKVSPESPLAPTTKAEREEEREEKRKGKRKKKREEQREEQKEEIKVTFPRGEEDNQAEEIYREALRAVKAQFDSVSRGRKLTISKGIERIGARIVESLYTGDESLIGLIARGSKENYLYNHVVNNCVLAVKVGLALGLNIDELRELAICALIHDVGMTKLQPIWSQPRKLSSEEMAEVRKHPVWSREISAKIAGISSLIAEVAHQHQERANGKGYPRGIKEEEMHEYAKLIAVIDVYEALTHERVYRKAYMPSEAIKMIMDESEKLFSHKIVKALVEELSLYPIGSLVQLNTNEVGRVVGANKGFPLRPRLKIITDSSGHRLEGPKLADLAKQTSLYIKKAVSEEELKG